MTSRIRSAGASTLAALSLLACAVQEEAVQDEMGQDEASAMQALVAPALATTLSDDDFTPLRAALGFRNEPGFLEDLHRNPQAHDARSSSRQVLLGLTMTPDEVHAMGIRHRLERASADIEAAAREEAGDDFAGLHIVRGGPEMGGIVRVLVTSGEGRVADALRHQAGADADRIEVVEVEHSLIDLQEREREVARALVEMGVDYNSTSVDVIANQVTIAVARLTDELRDEIVDEVGDDAIGFVEEGGRPVPVGNKDERLIYDLIEGGQELNSGLVSCTSGFAAHGLYGPFILTAGHCWNVGDPVCQGGWMAGTVAAREWRDGAVFDAEAISTAGHRNQAGRFHRNADDFFSPIHWSVGRDADPWIKPTGDDRLQLAHPAERQGYREFSRRGRRGGRRRLQRGRRGRGRGGGSGSGRRRRRGRGRDRGRRQRMM